MTTAPAQPSIQTNSARNTTDVPVLRIPVDAITPRPLNPRKHFDQEAREELASTKRRVTEVRHQRDCLENDLLDEVKKRKRLEKRVQAGVCPYCKRAFQNLARHMNCKHNEAKSA